MDADQKLCLDVEIPVNTTATLGVPKRYSTVMELGVIKEIEMNTLTLGSGVYHFIMK